MSVLIKNMKMPENCITCPFAERVPPGRTRCLITYRFLADGYNKPSPERNEFCPLVAQPEIRTQMSSANCISRQEAIDAVMKLMPSLTTPDGSGQFDAEIFRMQEMFVDIGQVLNDLPSAQPEWNNHTVACLLAELFDDTCACNYNDIDEWLPEKCELLDSCPNPVGVACWEQFLKHKAERRSE